MTKMQRSSRDGHGAPSLPRRRFLGSVIATSLYPLVAPMVVRAQTASFDYYISPAGSDSNAGTAASPWSISALQSKSQIAGKRIGLLDGTYAISGLLTSALSANNNDAILNITAGGTSGARTVIQAVTPQKAIITTLGAGGYPAGTWPAVGLSGNYITLDGLKFTGLSFFAVKVFGSNIVIQNCEISDIVGSRQGGGWTNGDNCGGIMTGNSGTGLTVNNCYIHDIYNTGTGAVTNNGCIGPLYMYAGITVTNCTLTNSGHAIGAKRSVGQVTAYNNFIANMQQYAIRSMFEEDSTHSPLGGSFHHNVIVDCRNISGGDSPQNGMLPRNTDVYNNTFVFRTGISAAALIHFNGPSNTSGVGSRNRYYNNIFLVPDSVSPQEGVLFFYPGANNHAVNRLAVCNWNCWGQSSAQFMIGDAGTSYSSRAAWQAAAGFDANSVVADPLLANLGGTTPADFKLSSNSPCRGAGKSGGTSGGSAADIGAWDGATQIGHSFGPASQTPDAPQLQVS